MDSNEPSVSDYVSPAFPPGSSPATYFLKVCLDHLWVTCISYSLEWVFPPVIPEMHASLVTSALPLESPVLLESLHCESVWDILRFMWDMLSFEVSERKHWLTPLQSYYDWPINRFMGPPKLVVTDVYILIDTMCNIMWEFYLTSQTTGQFNKKLIGWSTFEILLTISNFATCQLTLIRLGGL